MLCLQDLWKDFETLDDAQKVRFAIFTLLLRGRSVQHSLNGCSLVCPQVVKLQAFSKFDNTIEALAAATALVDSKLSKGKSG